MGLSIILFVPRASKLTVRELIVTPERVVRERLPQDPPANSVLIYDLEGELFFGAAPELDRYLDNFKDNLVNSGIRCIVLRLRRTRNPDMVAIEHLERFLHDTEKLGVMVILAGVRPDLAKILDNAHFPSWLPADRVFPEQNEQYSATLDAVRYAYKLLGQNGVETTHGQDAEEEFYYMI